MKILIILGHNRFTGVNTWALDLIKSLTKYKYEVDVEIRKDYKFIPHYTPFISLLSDHVSNIIISQPMFYNNYDVIFLFYNTHEHLIPDNCKTIFIIHGTDFLNYQPIKQHNRCVGISNQIKQLFNCDELIVNGVDLSLFKPSTIRKKLKILLYLDRHKIPEPLNLACKYLNIKIIHAKGTYTQSNIVDLMSQVDAVVGYGRSVYEGMASGKPVLVYGNYGCDGWVKEYDFVDILNNNCNGSYYKRKLDVDDLIGLLTLYNTEDGNINRRLASTFVNYTHMGVKFHNLIQGLF